MKFKNILIIALVVVGLLTILFFVFRKKTTPQAPNSPGSGGTLPGGARPIGNESTSFNWNNVQQDLEFSWPQFNEAFNMQ